MRIDITLPITVEMLNEAKENTNKALEGHLGTHFDVMDKVFPLDYTRRDAVAFDVSGVSQRDINVTDIDISLVKKDMFVLFYTGFINREPYGTRRYYKEHPQLSQELIDRLIQIGVSIIGLDFAGVRRGAEHIPADQRCADNNVFVIENLCNLEQLIGESKVVINTYPLSCVGISGLPCRVIAELKKA